MCRSWIGLLFGLLALASAPSASAHELAIDQIMLWPEPSSGVLRGELAFDPELTRGKDVQPTAEHERQVIAFLSANLRVSSNGQPLPLDFEVRELWVRGGATLGDVVELSAPWPAEARELRVFASGAFKALVVSVQSSSGTGRVATTSWLLGPDEWSPIYRLGAGWQQPGWRSGGPDVFQGAVSPRVAARGEPPTASVEPASSDDRRAAHPSGVAARFVQLGFEHILPGGIDHMLFVAGLVLGSARRHRQVLIALSLFTLAHTLTLALANFHVLEVPSSVVEPLIAFSIFLLGVDNLRQGALRPCPAVVERRDTLRYAVVFCFGLVHGLGFASALSALAFGGEQVVLALLSFNVGVELGQIAVAALIGLMLYLIRERRSLERYAVVAGSAAIAVSGLIMVFNRLVPVHATFT